MLRRLAHARPRALGSVFTAALSMFAVPAAASGPVEAFVAVARHPSESGRLVVGYSNTSTRSGLLFSDDAGASFSLLCSAAMAEVAIDALPDLASEQADTLRSSFTRARLVRMTGDGTLLVGSSSGLFVDSQNGCAFARVEALAGLWIAGLAAHPTDPAVTFAITNGTSGATSEGLWRRNADGSFEQLAQVAPVPTGESWSVSGLQVVEHEGGLRFYTAQVRYVSATQELSAYLRYSDDQGASWTDHVVELPEQAGFSILAVDPTNAQRLVGRFSRSDDSNEWEAERDSVLVSDDAGATFREYLQVTEVGGVWFEPDGSLWVADAGKTTGGGLPVGLHRGAPGLGVAPEAVLTDRPVTCIGPGPAEGLLYACSRYDFGTFDPEDDTFMPLVTTQTVPTLHTCNGQDVVADCRDQLCQSGWCGPGHFATAPFCAAYDEPYCGNDADNWNDEPDAGAPDAGAPDAGLADAGASEDPDAGSPVANPPTPLGDAGSDAPVAKASSSCAIAGVPGQAGGAALPLLTLFGGALALRRRAHRKGKGALAALLAAGLSLLGCGDSKPAAGDDDHHHHHDASHDDQDAGHADHDAGDHLHDGDSGLPEARCPDDLPTFEPGLTQLGTDEKIQAKLLSADPSMPFKGANDWSLEFTTKDGEPIADLEVQRASTFMPVHNHNGKFEPTVTSLSSGVGRFGFEGLNFTMRGPWEVRIELSSESVGDDYVVFTVCVGE